MVGLDRLLARKCFGGLGGRRWGYALEVSMSDELKKLEGKVIVLQVCLGDLIILTYRGNVPISNALRELYTTFARTFQECDTLTAKGGQEVLDDFVMRIDKANEGLLD